MVATFEFDVVGRSVQDPQHPVQDLCGEGALPLLPAHELANLVHAEGPLLALPGVFVVAMIRTAPDASRTSSRVPFSLQ
jgi:hypothetical protein